MKLTYVNNIIWIKC